MLEKLLDMDNPSLNKELYQIFIDYDGIHFLSKILLLQINKL